jgi:hypothetical protein
MSEPSKDIDDVDINAEIKAAAKKFVEDNLKSPTPSDYLAFETVALIGAGILATHVSNRAALDCL